MTFKDRRTLGFHYFQSHGKRLFFGYMQKQTSLKVMIVLRAKKRSFCAPISSDTRAKSMASCARRFSKNLHRFQIGRATNVTQF